MHCAAETTWSYVSEVVYKYPFFCEYVCFCFEYRSIDIYLALAVCVVRKIVHRRVVAYGQNRYMYLTGGKLRHKRHPSFFAKAHKGSREIACVAISYCRCTAVDCCSYPLSNRRMELVLDKVTRFAHALDRFGNT